MPPVSHPHSAVSSEWVKWLAGMLVVLNSVTVGYVVKMESRVATLEAGSVDGDRAFALHLADAKEMKIDIYNRLGMVDSKQLEILGAIGLVREDVAAIRGAVGAGRHRTY